MANEPSPWWINVGTFHESGVTDSCLATPPQPSAAQPGVWTHTEGWAIDPAACFISLCFLRGVKKIDSG